MKNACEKRALMFYINTIEFGGAERVMVNLCNHFCEQGYRVVLVTSYKSEKEYIINDKIERVNLETNKRCGVLQRNISRVKKLRKLCIMYKPYFVLSFLAEANFRNIIATFGTKTKCFVSVRNDPNREYGNFLNKFLAKNLFKLADGCVFQTNEAKQWFPKYVQDKSCIIMNEVDYKFFETYDKREESCTIVNVGRLTEQKNQKLLIQAFAEVVQEYPYINLEIWGEGPLKEELIRCSRELDVYEKVKIKGVSNDVPAVLNKALFFVLSSDYEGMPNVLLEAVASGCPVISTDCPCGGPREIITDGENGFLVPVRNKKMLVSKMKKLIVDSKLRDRIRENEKITSQQFCTDIVFDKWKRFLLG